MKKASTTVINRLKEIDEQKQPEESKQARVSKTERLIKLISGLSEKHLIIAMRGYPDPDSIASAMALAHIFNHYKVQSTILYFDDISHYENRALVKQLDVPMVRYDGNFDFTEYDGIFLVDSQNMGMPGLEETCPIYGIVDHHKLQGEHHAEFIDIRESAGSTCTIFAEYLSEGAAPLNEQEVEHQKIATAMLVGIRSDTDDFITANLHDFDAASYLVDFSDRDLLRLIANQSISSATMEVTQRAFANRIINDTYLISGVGFVREEDRDSIGQAADYLLKREGIDTVIVYGIINDSLVDVSHRTKSNVVDPDRFLKDVFGVDPYGTAYGGGRRDKGAFKIPLGPFSACSNRELLWRFVKHTVEDLSFNKLGMSRED